MDYQTYSEICQYLKELIAGTEWEGHIYTVGGCCRDTIMQQPINDIDLAVTYPDGGIAFAQWIYDKGLAVKEPTTFPKYGTARLRLKSFGGIELELVQTRSEKYTDHNSRNPSTAFGTIEEDCMRRDLTINSLYYDISAGKILDISGKSLNDIENKIIRTPLDPDTTFDDDPLRIIRAIRFSAKYGWAIDSVTLDAMKRHTDRLCIIKPERIQGEFEKILTGPRASYGLDMLRQIGVMPFISPELCKMFNLRQSKLHFGTVWEHTLAVVDKVPATPLMRYTALLHDIGKISTKTIDKDGNIRFPRHPERGKKIMAKVLNRLRYHKPFIDRVIFLCTHHERVKSWGKYIEQMKDSDLRRLQFECYTQVRFENLMTIIDADNNSYASDNCLDGQVELIMQRSAQLQKEKSDMFGYVLPVKPSRIAKLKGIKDNRKALDACKNYLLMLACTNPHMKREQMLKRLNQYNLPKL